MVQSANQQYLAQAEWDSNLQPAGCQTTEQYCSTGNCLIQTPIDLTLKQIKLKASIYFILVS